MQLIINHTKKGHFYRNKIRGAIQTFVRPSFSVQKLLLEVLVKATKVERKAEDQ